MPYIGIKAVHILVIYNRGFGRLAGTLGYLVIFIRIRARNYRRYYCLYGITAAAISIGIAQNINLTAKGGTVA